MKSSVDGNNSSIHRRSDPHILNSSGDAEQYQPHAREPARDAGGYKPDARIYSTAGDLDRYRGDPRITDSSDDASSFRSQVHALLPAGHDIVTPPPRSGK